MTKPAIMIYFTINIDEVGRTGTITEAFEQKPSESIRSVLERMERRLGERLRELEGQARRFRDG